MSAEGSCIASAMSQLHGDCISTTCLQVCAGALLGLAVGLFFPVPTLVQIA